MSVQPTPTGVQTPDLSGAAHPIAGVSTSVTGFIGYLRRGPIGAPVQITSFDAFQQVFGGLDEASDTSYQVSQFFLNGGSECWVSRCVAASQPPVLPGAVLDCGPGGGSLTVNAANPGTWGEAIYLTIDYLTPAGSSTFNLHATLYDFTGGDATIVQTTTLAGAAVGYNQPSNVEAMLAQLGDAALIAIPAPPPNMMAPLPTGTVFNFTAPDTIQSGLSLTVSITPPGGATPPPPVTVPIGPVQSLDSFVSALQGALTAAASQMNMPALASATVNAGPSPFQDETLVQILLTDPREASTLVNVSCSQPALATQAQVGVHAIPLVAPPATTTSATPPDGAPPAGGDLAGDPNLRTGVFAFDDIPILNLLCAPDLRAMSSYDYRTGASAILNYALKRQAFAILDPPSREDTVTKVLAWARRTPPKLGPGVISAAAYFPAVLVPDPLGAQSRTIGASGTIAGLYANTDATYGVWTTPTGINATLTGVNGLACPVTDLDVSGFMERGLNTLRTFSTCGDVAWGSETLAGANPTDQDWRYLSVRRLALYIEQSVTQGLQWAAFEPYSSDLQAQIVLDVEAFLRDLYRRGAFPSAPTSRTAYEVTSQFQNTVLGGVGYSAIDITIGIGAGAIGRYAPIKVQRIVGLPPPA